MMSHRCPKTLNVRSTRNATEREDMAKEMHERERRALAAYWRNPGYERPHPPGRTVHAMKDGNEYVVLQAEQVGTIAVFRVRRDGQLRRLRRPPDMEQA
jgi:hypothetical protein